MKPATKESIQKHLGRFKRSKTIVSKFPMCPWEHKSWGLRKQHMILQEQKHKSKNVVDPMPDICDKEGRKKYKIVCPECKETVGTVWLKEENLLKNWCSFRYQNKITRKGWKGAWSPNISPYTGELTIECTCGNKDHKLCH
jgi:hypothetical protein